jgi:hypothetical protein
VRVLLAWGGVVGTLSVVLSGLGCGFGFATRRRGVAAARGVRAGLLRWFCGGEGFDEVGWYHVSFSFSLVFKVTVDFGSDGVRVASKSVQAEEAAAGVGTAIGYKELRVEEDDLVFEFGVERVHGLVLFGFGFSGLAWRRAAEPRSGSAALLVVSFCSCEQLSGAALGDVLVDRVTDTETLRGERLDPEVLTLKLARELVR